MHLFSFSQVKIYEVEIQNKNEGEIKKRWTSKARPTGAG